MEYFQETCLTKLVQNNIDYWNNCHRGSSRHSCPQQIQLKNTRLSIMWLAQKIMKNDVCRGIPPKNARSWKFMKNDHSKSCKSYKRLSALQLAQKIMKNDAWYVGYTSKKMQNGHAKWSCKSFIRLSPVHNAGNWGVTQTLLFPMSLCWSLLINYRYLGVFIYCCKVLCNCLKPFTD